MASRITHIDNGGFTYCGLDNSQPINVAGLGEIKFAAKLCKRCAGILGEANIKAFGGPIT